MNRDAARTQIQQQLGHRTDLVSVIEVALRNVQQELESDATLPWFLRVFSDPFTTTIGSNVISKPDDFIREWDEDPLLLFVGNESFALEKDSPSYLRRRYYEATRPMGYSELEDSFIIYPTPVAVYTMQMSYYGRDTVLNANIENKWLKYMPMLMIGRAGFVVASGVRDAKAQEIFGAMAKAGMEKMLSTTTAHDESGKRRVIGGED